MPAAIEQSLHSGGRSTVIFATKRRSLLMGAASAGGIGVTGCGGSGSDTSGPAVPQADQVPTLWDPSPWMWFIAGASRSVDLALTLPSGIVRGGVFELASGSAPLPRGLSLSPAGMLSAKEPAESRTANVVFTYAEPGP